MTGNNIVADTNIFIDLMKGNEAIAKKLESFDEVYLSPVMLAELYFGAYRSANPEKHLRNMDSCHLLAARVTSLHQR
jgi:tRNA(fMet)-specific endonuclease VapC